MSAGISYNDDVGPIEPSIRRTRHRRADQYLKMRSEHDHGTLYRQKKDGGFNANAYYPCVAATALSG